MDDILSTFKARQTLLEMACDRGYTVPEEQFAVDVATFRHLYNISKCDLLFSKEAAASDQKIYIKFIQAGKARPNMIRDMAQHYFKHVLTPASELIFVLKLRPNNSILKIRKELGYERCEFFWLDRLQFNITKHVLVPQHQKTSPEEVKKIIDMYKLSNISQLPRLTTADPVVQYYNFKRGDVIKIVRPSPTSFSHVVYRSVV